MRIQLKKDRETELQERQKEDAKREANQKAFEKRQDMIEQLLEKVTKDVFQDAKQDPWHKDISTPKGSNTPTRGAEPAGGARGD